MNQGETPLSDLNQGEAEPSYMNQAETDALLGDEQPTYMNSGEVDQPTYMNSSPSRLGNLHPLAVENNTESSVDESSGE